MTPLPLVDEWMGLAVVRPVSLGDDSPPAALGSWVRDCMRLVPGGGWYPGDKVREP